MTVDSVTLRVMSNRLNGIVSEMTHTMVRTARSTTMAARDFSCSITSSENDMVSFAEGAPVHVYGSSLIAEAMQDTHPEFREGDCYMTNDPVGEVDIRDGQCIGSLSAGGGYGLPWTRDPAAVLTDVIDGFISIGRAREVYGVVLRGDAGRPETLTVDPEASVGQRAVLSALAPLALEQDDATRAPQPPLHWWVADGAPA